MQWRSPFGQDFHIIHIIYIHTEGPPRQYFTTPSSMRARSPNIITTHTCGKCECTIGKMGGTALVSKETVTVSPFLVDFQHHGTNKTCSFTLNCSSRSSNPKPDEKLNQLNTPLNTSVVNKVIEQRPLWGKRENGDCTAKQGIEASRVWDVTEILGQPPGQPPWGMPTMDTCVCWGRALLWGRSLGFARGVERSMAIWGWSCGFFGNATPF